MRYDWTKAPCWAKAGILTSSGRGYWIDAVNVYPLTKYNWGLPYDVHTWLMKPSEILDTSGDWIKSLEYRP